MVAIDIVYIKCNNNGSTYNFVNQHKFHFPIVQNANVQKLYIHCIYVATTNFLQSI